MRSGRAVVRWQVRRAATTRQDDLRARDVPNGKITVRDATVFVTPSCASSEGY